MADLSITVANVAKGSDAVLKTGVAGATLTAGQSIYLDTAAANVAKPYDANASAATSVLEGVTLHAALSGQPITYITGGSWTVGATVAVGTIYVGSATAGGIAPSTDLVTGWYTSIVGVATSATVIKYLGFNSGVAVP